jgi:hypothetical protein
MSSPIHCPEWTVGFRFRDGPEPDPALLGRYAADAGTGTRWLWRLSEMDERRMAAR